MAQSTESATEGRRSCKRYIATYDGNGKSVYAESPGQAFNSVPGFGEVARSYAISSVPADLKDDADVKAYKAKEGVTSYTQRDVVLPQPGANLFVIDLELGGVSAMHRTVSVDFSICCVGEIDHELDGGERVRMYPGDHIVQRGTMHRWHNASKEKPARLLACTIPCVLFDINGEPLKEVYLSDEESPKV